jgi:glycosyltransferase involved in cell wall biosynthesis
MISVIVPAYNLEKYIARTLDSILAQTIKDLEIVVVDDGSVDKTGMIIDEYSKSYPEKIVSIHISNRGVTNARLTGVKKAKGEWIGFVDGDDEIEPDMYEILLNNAIKYGVDISHCGYQMYFRDGRINYFYNTGDTIIQDNLTGLKDLLDGSIIEPGLWNKLYKRELFSNVLYDNIMDLSIKINEDLLMNYILFMNSKKSVFYDVCKYHYIVRNSSASRATLNLNKIYDPIKVKEIIYNISPESMKSMAQSAYLSTCINVYSGLVCDKSNKFKDEPKKVRKMILNNKKYIGLLRRNTKILMCMIMYAPWCYGFIYNFYSKYFQNHKYD